MCTLGLMQYNVPIIKISYCYSLAYVYIEQIVTNMEKDKSPTSIVINNK